MKFNYKYILPISLIALAGCSLDDATFEAEEPTQATKDLFTSYVAIGNSLTAGFTNQGIRSDFQVNSFPAQLARAAGKIAEDNGATTSVDEFEIPYVASPGISSLGGNTGTTEFVGLDATTCSPKILPNGTYTDTELPTMLVNSQLARPYNNLGIPGATAFQVMITQGNADPTSAGNAYFDVVLRGQGTAIQQAMAMQPTFASVWLGNNEVLGYATAGGALDLDPNTPGITPFNKDGFALYYSSIWDSLKSVNPDIKGFTCTVPKITNAPFFTTVKHVLVNACTQEVLGPIWGQQTDGTTRHIAADEFVLLTASSVLSPTGVGSDSLNPLTTQYWLDSDEITVINDFTDSYNATINAVATANGIPVFDTNAFLEEFLPANGGKGVLAGIDPLTTEFLTGGVFGLDGVHPNPLGYGLLANELMDMINEKYGTNLQHVNLNKLVGIVE